MNNKEEAIGYLFMYIEVVFQVGISRNPNDITLRIAYIQFLISRLNKIHKAYSELILCESLDKNIEEEFIIYRHKKQFGENGDFNFVEEIDDSGLNVLFQNNFVKFKNLIIKVSFLYIDFWSLLYENQMEEQQDMTVLNEYGNQINLGVEEIHKLFNKLQKIKENEPELLELYSDFLKEIRADYEQSKELNLILNKVQKRLKNDDMDELNWINSFNIDIYALNNSDKNLYLVFDTKINNFGTILNVSLGLCSILGYHKEELKGKHINLLIPEIFHSSHRSLLKKLIEEYQKGHRAKKKVDFRSTDTFAVNKSKYLFQFNFKAFVISIN
jgi:PAS domain-containing protein